MYSLRKGKQKNPERTTSRSRSQPPIPGEREKVTQINVCTANKQMHDKHKDQLPSSPSKMFKMLKGQKKHIDKVKGKTKHEAPRNVNYRATRNKNNIGTTALERSVVYTTGGLKAVHCINYRATQKRTTSGPTLQE